MHWSEGDASGTLERTPEPGGSTLERTHLALTERQAVHRQRLEREAVHSANVVEQRGQAIAALIGVLAIVCGTYLMATDHDGWGFATIVTAIAGLVGASVFSRRLADRDAAAQDAVPPTGST